VPVPHAASSLLLSTRQHRQAGLWTSLRFGSPGAGPSGL